MASGIAGRRPPRSRSSSDWGTGAVRRTASAQTLVPSSSVSSKPSPEQARADSLRAEANVQAVREVFRQGDRRALHPAGRHADPAVDSGPLDEPVLLPRVELPPKRRRLRRRRGRSAGLHAEDSRRENTARDPAAPRARPPRSPSGSEGGPRPPRSRKGRSTRSAVSSWSRARSGERERPNRRRRRSRTRPPSVPRGRPAARPLGEVSRVPGGEEDVPALAHDSAGDLAPDPAGSPGDGNRLARMPPVSLCDGRGAPD